MTELEEKIFNRLNDFQKSKFLGVLIGKNSEHYPHCIVFKDGEDYFGWWDIISVKEICVPHLGWLVINTRPSLIPHIRQLEFKKELNQILE